MFTTVGSREVYGPGCYRLRPEQLAVLRVKHPWRPVLQIVGVWVSVALLVQGALHWLWLAPLCALFIAGRAGVLLQVTHEAAHKLICEGPWNERIGEWLAAAPIGLALAGYQEGHLQHHRYANTAREPAADAEKYKICDPRDPRLWGLFLKDLTGWTALSVRWQYLQQDVQRPQAGAGWLRTAGWQLLIIGAIFQFHVLAYALLWLLPLTTLHMVLMRVRGIAEHGLGVQLRVPDLGKDQRGDLYTRSLGTPQRQYRLKLWNWIERILIGSLHVNYHHEHHLYPSVPYYHLPALHRLLRGPILDRNPSVYAAGYVGALWSRGVVA